MLQILEARQKGTENDQSQVELRVQAKNPKMHSKFEELSLKVAENTKGEQNDVGTLANDMKTMQGKVNSLTTDLKGLTQNMTGMTSSISEVAFNIGNVTQDFAKTG